jgi:hypothetical protein
VPQRVNTAILQSPTLSISVLLLVSTLWTIWPWSSAGLWLVPPSYCFVLCFSICCHILDWFLLVCSLFWSSNLLPLLMWPCPILHIWVLVSPGTACGIFIASSAGLWPSSLLLFCFGFIYLLIIHYTFSFFFLILCSCKCSYVFRYHTFRISSATERLSSKVHWLPRFPSLPPLLPIWTLYWDIRFSFWILDLWQWEQYFVSKRQ